MLAQERAELIELLHDLSDEDWETPSLCAGWRVRDVVGHLLSDNIAPVDYAGIVLRHRFAVDRVNETLVGKARSLSTAELVDRFEHRTGKLSRFAPKLVLADTFVHQQDIRRPLNRPRTVPAERLAMVLAHPDPFASPWRNTKGLRFVATDVDWARGTGPEVRGTGEALALAMVGRTVALADLDGDGVAELRRRLS
ncbi:maleylpyruvate isomerase family mycothiol-dependent enzyme [Nocardia puris]|uniref:Uncharacterized protein (TIGR03083 family) n=1 Tax=Nocardia puris TaxID=208602 RepID=A0A366DJE9_9NOCA|nr:maleylpyruvate isomerase family mycothiol-dependent enzyme [Nocardia puris]MBF6213188.1 maleylpyruvate isomerase family mycothiol-dependent enzyme [Nocardia puris]MBF6370141.1 maleylpyruvate isomerase family mycothiol-dependent enzyme [Nocardia puris]MBF6462067.1 maleylpyruvate isomerase family mycothiol-dependent enzyme [Nocardia puris]RBO89368.1 uncharacterized protein (TIGR03083 family) [Nocardia puris]